MKNLYNEFFHVPKHGKVRESVMMYRVVKTIAVIAFCLIAMSVTAYAYFSHSITTATVTIKAAVFETEVSIRITDENGAPVTVTTDDEQTHVAALAADKTYFVTLKHADASTAKTGFVILEAVGCAERYHTQQLGKDGDGVTETLTFTLRPSEDTTVTFTAHWGTSSYYGYPVGSSPLYICEGNSVALAIAPPLKAPAPSTSTTVTTTVTAATTTTATTVTTAATTVTTTTVETTTAATTAETTVTEATTTIPTTATSMSEETTTAVTTTTTSE